MIPGNERAPTTRWHRLLLLSQRWYVRLGVMALGIIAFFRFIPGGVLLTVAGVVLLAGWLAVMVGKVVLALPQLNAELDSWPDNWWTRWARPSVRVAVLATIGPWFLGLLCIPLIVINPTLLHTPFKTVFTTLVMIAAGPWVLLGVLLILSALAALTVALPIAIIRATARARRRRHYDYPPHLPRRAR